MNGFKPFITGGKSPTIRYGTPIDFFKAFYDVRNVFYLWWVISYVWLDVYQTQDHPTFKNPLFSYSERREAKNYGVDLKMRVNWLCNIFKHWLLHLMFTGLPQNLSNQSSYFKLFAIYLGIHEKGPRETA